MKFVSNQPALVIGKTLVIADVHLGIEHELARAGFRVPDQTERVIERIKKLLKQTKCTRLVILGDVKHKIAGLAWDEQRTLHRFFSELGKTAEVCVVKGNHDGGIEKYCAKVAGPRGMKINGVLLVHGHARPRPEDLKSKRIVMAHVHPVIEIRDALGGRHAEKAWLDDGRIIIMPAFSELLGGQDVRKGILGPMKSLFRLEDADIYLLDGLHLGRIGELK